MDTKHPGREATDAKEARTDINLDNLKIEMGLILPPRWDGDYAGAITSWSASIGYRDPEEDTDDYATIGAILGHVVDLEADFGHYDVLDSIDGDLEAIGAALFLSGRTAPGVFEYASHLITVDRVFVEPGYRGQSVGPRAVGDCIDQLARARICVAALIAQPDGWEKMSKTAVHEAQQKIQRAWSVGFVPLRGNVMWAYCPELDSPAREHRTTSTPPTRAVHRIGCI